MIVVSSFDVIIMSFLRKDDTNTKEHDISILSNDSGFTRRSFIRNGSCYLNIFV